MGLYLVTYNLRCTFKKGDGENCFIHRAGMILDKINTEKPDVICFQECIPGNAEFLRKYLTDYNFIFNQRDDGFNGEGLAFAIKKDVIELYGLEMFWLSETPDVPGSRFEGQSNCPRIAQLITLRDVRTGKMFRVCNTHLDHIGEFAKVEGIKLILKTATERNGQRPMPFILVGDFNATPDSETIKYCNEFKDLSIVDTTVSLGGSWHNFGKPSPFPERVKEGVKIDYIFVDKDLAKSQFTSGFWDDELNGIYLSDHYPVFLKIEL